MTPLRDAYRAAVLDKGNTRRMGWGRQTVLNRRVQVRKRRYPTEVVMRRVLKKLGWKKVMEEQWARP